MTVTYFLQASDSEVQKTKLEKRLKKTQKKLQKATAEAAKYAADLEQANKVIAGLSPIGVRVEKVWLRFVGELTGCSGGR